MKYINLYLWGTVGLLCVLSMAGCGPRESMRIGNGYVSVDKWENYQCFAVNTSTLVKYTGWATSERRAKDIAVSKCEAHRGPGSCHLISCTRKP